MTSFIKPNNYLLLLFTITLLLTACTPPKPNTPMTVAQAFWTAALDGDVETAKTFLTPQSRPNFKVILQSNKDFVELGEQSITTTEAEILTQLTQHKNNQPYKTALRTILINHQGQWLVDFDKTKSSMLGSELQSTLEQFSETIKETINKGAQIMGESFKEEVEEMERSMQDTLKDFNKELEELEKQQQEQEQEHQNKTQPPETTTL